MLERVSALAGEALFEGAGVSIREVEGVRITQVAGDAEVLERMMPDCPARVGASSETRGMTLLRVGPSQAWVVGDTPNLSTDLSVTPLTSARTCIAVDGARARAILGSFSAIDFHEKVFARGSFVMTGLHHTPVLIHCVGDHVFHVYALRTFALSIWEALVDAARASP
jgi:methylglutamate dehydrogenase subunit D